MKKPKAPVAAFLRRRLLKKSKAALEGVPPVPLLDVLEHARNRAEEARSILTLALGQLEHSEEFAIVANGVVRLLEQLEDTVDPDQFRKLDQSPYLESV